MTHAESWKRISLEILRVHTEECGDGSCGCGCGIPIVEEFSDKAAVATDCCEPAFGPETCG